MRPIPGQVGSVALNSKFVKVLYLYGFRAVWSKGFVFGSSRGEGTFVKYVAESCQDSAYTMVLAI